MGLLKNVFYSVFWNKCPKCHKGKVFTYSNPFDYKNFDKMEIHCSNCDHKYEKEPGFFYGAMYVSYALMVGWFLFSWALNSFVLHMDELIYLALLAISMIALFSYTFRLARLFWINFFTTFEEDTTH